MTESNPLEGWFRCKSTGKHTDKIQSLELHIGRSIQCAINRDCTGTPSMITTHTAPVFINDAGYVTVDSPQRDANLEGLCKK